MVKTIAIAFDENGFLQVENDKATPYDFGVRFYDLIKDKKRDSFSKHLQELWH